MGQGAAAPRFSLAGRVAEDGARYFGPYGSRGATQGIIEALRAERFRVANRFQLALPKYPGVIRLSSIDDEVLERHARAFIASRKPE